jgi:N-formylglutamate deformylase
MSSSARQLPRILVLHTPHSSHFVPPEERGAILLDDAGLRSELWRMTDAYTDELFPVTPVEAGRVVFPVSRLVCDVERFSSDEEEPMSKRGMGVIYTRTSMGDLLRARPNAAQRQYILDRWYWPHHFKLEQMVKDVVARAEACLIIDCHSFPAVALPYELDQTKERPDICIGTDSFHTPTSVRDALVTAVNDLGFSVAVDAPFAGALVPVAAYRKDWRVLSVMIEVNRRLYMDEHSGAKNDNFENIRAAMKYLITTAAHATAAQTGP